MPPKEVTEGAGWQDRSHSLWLLSHGSDIPSNFSYFVDEKESLRATHTQRQGIRQECEYQEAGSRGAILVSGC